MDGGGVRHGGSELAIWQLGRHPMRVTFGQAMFLASLLYTIDV